MRGLINDLLRWAIACTIGLLGFILQVTQRFQIANFKRTQQQLKRLFGVTSQTQILTFGPEL
jgi:hypothetical protein